MILMVSAEDVVYMPGTCRRCSWSWWYRL